MGDPHVPSNERGVHKSVTGGAVDGGACLDHNEGGYKKDTCCYRFQAKSEPRKGAYHEVYKQYVLKGDTAALRKRIARFRQQGSVDDFLLTNQFKTQAGGVCPANTDYSDRLGLPENQGDWDLDGPPTGTTLPSVAKAKTAKKKVIKAGKNFTKAFWPYWNNAHHLISKATFADRITGITDLATRRLVQVGLLRVMYNINHHKNVIFLPMDEEVGQLVLLPRHLTLGGSSATPDPNPFFDHRGYNGLVDTELDDVFKGFIAEADKARKGKKLCDALKVVKLSREKLEQLSERLFQTIRKAQPGDPLVDIKKVVAFGKKKKG